VVGLALLGVGASQGLAYGVLYHLTQIVPVVVLGGDFSIRSQVSLGAGEGGELPQEGAGNEKTDDTARLRRDKSKGVKLF